MAKVKFEDTLKGLEDIVEQLEKGDLSLDEALFKYENGIKLYKQCVSMLEDAEKKIKILVKDGNGVLRSKGFEAEANKQTNSKSDSI